MFRGVVLSLSDLILEVLENNPKDELRAKAILHMIIGSKIRSMTPSVIKRETAKIRTECNRLANRKKIRRKHRGFYQAKPSPRIIQKLENPEVSGVCYQQGELYGYEIKEYLLEKWGRKCVYCDAINTRLEVDHIVPKSLGGSNRVSNLTISCRACNERKSNLPIAQFLKEKPGSNS